MATRSSGRGTDAVALHAAIGRQVLVLASTGVETLALAIWLEAVLAAPVVSATAATGIGVLAAGLLVEHVLADLTVNGPDVSVPPGFVVANATSEAASWGLWLAIATWLGGADGFLLAGGTLGALLVPQHSVQVAVRRGRPPFSNVVNAGTVGFSVLEAAGATAWLVLVVRGDRVRSVLVDHGLAWVDPAAAGVGLLAVSLFVEHNLGVALARRS